MSKNDAKTYLHIFFIQDLSRNSFKFTYEELVGYHTIVDCLSRLTYVSYGSPKPNVNAIKILKKYPV